jgi:uncharacterized membrane protein
MTTPTIIATALSALMAGLFFGFSTFTMGGLRRIPARDGLVAMQGINVAATRSASFLIVFLGGAVYTAVLGVLAATDLDQPGAPNQLAGAILNITGVLITMSYHVPRNNALDAINPQDTHATTAWTEYAPTWTRANHLRTLTYLASTIAFGTALSQH